MKWLLPLCAVGVTEGVTVDMQKNEELSSTSNNTLWNDTNASIIFNEINRKI